MIISKFLGHMRSTKVNFSATVKTLGLKAKIFGNLRPYYVKVLAGTAYAPRVLLLCGLNPGRVEGRVQGLEQNPPPPLPPMLCQTPVTCFPIPFALLFNGYSFLYGGRGGKGGNRELEPR